MNSTHQTNLLDILSDLEASYLVNSVDPGDKSEQADACREVAQDIRSKIDTIRYCLALKDNAPSGNWPMFFSGTLDIKGDEPTFPFGLRPKNNDAEQGVD